MLFELIASKGFARMIRFIPASTAVAAVLTFGCDTEDNAATTTDSGTGSDGTGGTATNDSSAETAGAGAPEGRLPDPQIVPPVEALDGALALLSPAEKPAIFPESTPLRI